MNENKPNKTGDLLKDYDLESRIFSPQSPNQDFESNLVDINYSQIEQKLQIAIANSQEHLFTMLKNRKVLENIS